jgi:adenine deaminase
MQSALTFTVASFSGEKLSDNTWLANEYRENPDAIDLSEFMAVPNVISGHKDVVALFWDNKLGVDVDVRIHIFT